MAMKMQFNGSRGFSKGRGAVRRRRRNSGYTWRPLKAQAAIFDGIMFLLLVSLSVAMMFSFLSDYGIAQSRILRSAHTLNYVQGIGKAIYALDVSQLEAINLNSGSEWPGPTCEALTPFHSNTVADLLKRDVADGRFDNRFGESEGPNAPGKLALRCALKELMKPIVGSGYDYHAEILDGRSNFMPFPIIQDEPEPFLITNLATSDELYAAAESANGCSAISSALEGKQLLAISTPFRVFNEDGTAFDHQLRICMWPSERI